MSLKIWLPLNEDLRNQGIEKITIGSNNPTFTETGGKITGGYYTFSGSNYLSIPKVILPSQTSNWSFTCWFYLADTTTTTATCLFSERTGTDSKGYTIFLYPNNSKMLIDDGTRWTVTPMTFVAETWYHLAITRSPSGKKLYINGELKSSTATVGSTSSINSNGALIGYAQSSTALTTGSQGFKGRLNDVRIYDHCLSANEVKVISQNLIIHYQFNNENEIYNINENILTGVNEQTSLPSSGGSQPNKTWQYGSGGNGVCSLIDITNDSPVEGLTVGYSIANNTTGNRDIQQYNIPYGSYTGYYIASWYCRGTGTRLFRVWNGTTSKALRTSTATLSDTSTWVRQSYGFATTAIYGNNNCSFHLGLQGAGSIEICGMKLEAGNTVTSWVPSVLDKKPNKQRMVYDVSGYHHNGEIIGPVSIDPTSPEHSGSIKFNHAAAKVKTQKSIDFTGCAESYTFAWWQYNTTTGNMAWGFGDGNRLNVYQTTTMSLNTGNGNDNAFYTSSGDTLSAANYKNAWHHFCVTGDGEASKLYMDGNYLATATNFVPITGSQIWFSGWQAAAQYTFNGCRLSDFRFYGTPLSADDIMLLFKDSKSATNTAAKPRDLS